MVEKTLDVPRCRERKETTVFKNVRKYDKFTFELNIIHNQCVSRLTYSLCAPSLIFYIFKEVVLYFYNDLYLFFFISRVKSREHKTRSELYCTVYILLKNCECIVKKILLRPIVIVSRIQIVFNQTQNILR